MPDYGVLDAQSGGGLLPWSWAADRLTEAKAYWIATSQSDGRPHLMPVWGIWLEGRFYFSTGSRSRKARNLAADPRCVVSTERTDEPVILEGVAQRVADNDLLKRYAKCITEKYQWPTQATEDGIRDEFGNEGPVFAVQPQIAFGFGGDLSGTATRWTFDDD
jgi:general stress protein 26